MPWHVENDNPECSGFAVVKDADGSLAGCHETQAEADAQVAALYGQEPEMEAATAAAEYAAPTGEGTPIYGIAVVEGVETGDLPRREFSPGSLTFAPMPIPFKWQMAEGEAHDGAVVVGRVDDMWRDGALVRFRGVMDSAGENGAEAERLIEGKFLRGVSILADDIEDQDIELVFPEPDMPMLDEVLATLDGEAVEPLDDSPDVEPGDEASLDMVAAPMLAPRKVVTHAGRIRSLTLVAEPAFVEADVCLGESPHIPPIPDREPVAMVADAIVDEPDAGYAIENRKRPTVVTAAAYTITIPDIWPEAWFTEPTELPPFGALHITPEGRVFGLLAPNNVAHRAFRASGQKVTAPRNIDYSEFQNKPCIVAGADGHVYKIPAGNITFGCGHASPVDERRADPAWAMEHYENSCSIAARVRVGENKHGTWVAGALLHGISADTVERMMACALSGDWQGGKLNAALLVPVEGFPSATRASVRVREDAIVASSVPIQFDAPPAGPDTRPTLERIARGVGRDAGSRFAALRQRVGR